jgi:hypothetical protein
MYVFKLHLGLWQALNDSTGWAYFVSLIIAVVFIVCRPLF